MRFTLGAAFNSNFVLAQVSSPIFKLCEARDRTLGLIVCVSDVILELKNVFTNVSSYIIELFV